MITLYLQVVVLLLTNMEHLQLVETVLITNLGELFATLTYCRSRSLLCTKLLTVIRAMSIELACKYNLRIVTYKSYYEPFPRNDCHLTTV